MTCPSTQQALAVFLAKKSPNQLGTPFKTPICAAIGTFTPMVMSFYLFPMDLIVT